MVNGPRDVAGDVSQLGLTMTLPVGTCERAELDLERLEE